MRTLPWGALVMGVLVSAAMIVPKVTGWRAPQGRGYLALGTAFLLFFIAMSIAKFRSR